MSGGRAARRRRRGGTHPPTAQTIAQTLDENSRRFMELVNAVDLRSEISMDATQERLLKVYKEMALSEYDGMMKLRLYNLEKAEKDNDSTVYCLCKRQDGSGFMLQCDLCKEWFHGQCISLPKKLQSKPGSKQDLMQKVVKDLKYLCPCCERSRRPTLDSVYSLLLALQKLPVRLVEGAALECLAERAVQWQDNIQGFLVSTTEIAKAFSCYCKSSNITLPDNLMHQLRLKLTYPDVDRPQTRSYLHSESGSHLHQLQNKMRAAMAASRSSDGAAIPHGGAPNCTVAANATSNFPATRAPATAWAGTAGRPNSVVRPASVGTGNARKHMRKTPLLPRSDSLEGHGLDSITHSSPINPLNGNSSLSSSPPHMVSSVSGIPHSGVPGSNPYSSSMTSSVMRSHGHVPGGNASNFPPLASRPPSVGSACPTSGPQLHLSDAARRQMEDKLLEGDLIELQMDEKTWLWDMLCLSVSPASPPSHPSSPINASTGAGSSDAMDSPPLSSSIISHRRISSGSNGPPSNIVPGPERVCVAPRVRAEKEERLKKQRLQQWDLEHHGIAYSSSSSDSEMDLLRPSSLMRKTKGQGDPGLDEEDDSDGSLGSDASPRRKVISFYRQGGVARPVFGTRRSSSSDSSFDIEKQLPSRIAMRKDNPATVAYHTPRPAPGPRAKRPAHLNQPGPHQYLPQHHSLPHYQHPHHHQQMHPVSQQQHQQHHHLHPHRQSHHQYPHQHQLHHPHLQNQPPHQHHHLHSKHQQQALFISSASNHKGANALQSRRLQEPMSPPTNPPPRRRRKNASSGGPAGPSAGPANDPLPSKRRHVAPVERPPSSDDDSSSGGDLGDYKSGVCSVRYCEKPNAKVVQWIQCDNCQKWYHFQCIGLRNKMDAGQTFVCLRCKQREANAHDKLYYGRR